MLKKITCATRIVCLMWVDGPSFQFSSFIDGVLASAWAITSLLYRVGDEVLPPSCDLPPPIVFWRSNA